MITSYYKISLFCVSVSAFGSGFVTILFHQAPGLVVSQLYNIVVQSELENGTILKTAFRNLVPIKLDVLELWGFSIHPHVLSKLKFTGWVRIQSTGGAKTMQIY